MKTAIAKKQQNTRLVTVTPWAEEANTATKINHLDKVVKECGKTTVQAAVMCGWLLSIEKANRQGAFQAWAEANLNISKSSVYNYLNLFERAIANQTESQILVEANEKTREKMVEEYAETVESKTLTELYCDLGIVKKSKSNLGGFREGAGRKRKELTDAAQAAAAADAPEFAVEGANNAMLEFYQHGVIENGFLSMSLDNLKRVESMLTDVLGKVKAAMKVKQDK